MAYGELMDNLIINGYAVPPNEYVTLWGPDNCQYEADKVTEYDIYSIINSWIVRAINASYAAKVNLIGHSMGGLVSRYYCGRQYTPGQASNVNKVIMIGTPHLGVTEFYIWAFEYSAKQDADIILKKPETDENNLLLWGEPQYGVSCLIDISTGTPAWVPEPYESTFNPDDNPDVQYYSIYSDNHKDTPYELYVEQSGFGWCSVVSCITESGDDTVLDFSASAFAADPPPIGSGNHLSLCNQPSVISRVFEILSDR
jgi:pimeloyl-ACP methyl ester carboxylesterase